MARIRRAVLLAAPLCVAILGSAAFGRPAGPAPGGPPVLTVHGHEGWVSAVTFSPEGTRFASGGDDRTVKVWDSKSGRELLRLGHATGVTSLAFSPDGKRLVSGSWDGELKIWDSHTGRELLAVKAHAEKVTSVAFSPDGERLASGSDDDVLRVWDAKDGGEVLSLRPGDDYDVTAVAFSPDGNRLVSGDGEDRLRVWDSYTGDRLMSLSGHDGAVTAATFSPVGRRLVSGSWDDSLKVWDSEKGNEVLTLRGHSADVTSLAVSPDGKRIVSGSEDRTVRLWDARGGKELMTLRGHDDTVTCVAYSPDGRRVVSGSRSLLKLWKVAEEPIRGVHHAEEVKGSPVLTASGMAWWQGRLVLADRVPRQLRAYTPPDRWEILKTLTHPVGVAVDPGGHLIVTEKEKDVLNRLVQFKKDGGEETLAEGAGVGSPHFLAVHPNGTLYWSGFPDGGTRYLPPGSKDAVVARPRIVHTYGIGLSPNHDWLYVNSKIPNPDRRGTWRFPVDREGRLGEGEFFIQIDRFTTTHLKDLPAAQDGSTSLKGWVGRLQGLAVDKLGCLYVAGAESHTSGNAVAVFSPDGRELVAMVVGVPRNVSGLAFGGPDGRTLFITGAGEYKLFQARLPVAGEVFRD